MGLKADIDEVLDHWERATWRGRILLGLALFVSSTSLASLSESVAKWKGFFLDAINFYRSWISEPLLSKLGLLLGKPLPPHFIDAVVFFGFFFFAVARADLLRTLPPSRRLINMLVLATAYLYMVYAVGSSQDEPGSNPSSIWVLYPLYLLGAIVQTRGAGRLLVTVYMVAPVLFVGIVAAVSSGLAK